MMGRCGRTTCPCCSEAATGGCVQGSEITIEFAVRGPTAPITLPRTGGWDSVWGVSRCPQGDGIPLIRHSPVFSVRASLALSFLSAIYSKSSIPSGGRMGFITRQPLKSSVQRNREHLPINAKISAKKVQSSWALDNGIVAELIARRDDHLYETVYLSQQEAVEVARPLFSCMSVDAKRKLLVELLLEFVPEDLRDMLANALTPKATPRR